MNWITTIYRIFLTSLVLAIVIASIATYMDFLVNPSGIFYSAETIHWSIVFETFWSWFWPSMLLGCLAAIGVIITLLAARTLIKK